MKKLVLVLLGVMACFPFLRAETIDAVTFNPARLGQYERLKVTDGLNSRGGVETQSAAVQSSGIVAVDNEGNYQIPQAQINGYLNMPSTRFETPKFNSRGGTAYFDETAGTDVQSHIDALTQTALKVKANILNAGQVTVNGSSLGVQDYDASGVIKGLRLGGNDIPLDENCKGLTWAPRTDADGNTYKVLAMSDCTVSGSDCGTVRCLNWQQLNPVTCKCEDKPGACVPKACQIGQKFDESLCKCVEDDTTPDSAVCLSAGSEHTIYHAVQPGGVQCPTAVSSSPGVIYSWCYPNQSYINECMGRSDYVYGLPSGCTPGQPCNCTPGTRYIGYYGLPDARYVYCARYEAGIQETTAVMAYRFMVFNCFKGDSTCTHQQAGGNEFL